MMTAKMGVEEFEGNLKKFGISYSEACNLVWVKVRAVIVPNTLRQHMERYGSMSSAYTAAFRFLFRELERDHEHTT